MNSLLISLQIVMPMAVLMLAGHLLRHLGMLPESVTGACNRLVSSFFLPCMLFLNMYNSDLKTTFTPALFWLAIGGVLVTFSVLMLLVPRLEQSNPKRAVLIHGLFRGNTAIFGIPLAQGIIGESGHIDDLIVVMSVMIILYNILGVLTLQVFGEKKSTIQSVLKGIAQSPMVIGGLLGLILATMGWRLPLVIESPIISLAAVTTPLAFLSLGASFNLKASIHNRRYIAAVVVSRLIILPAVWLSVGVGLLGLRRGAVAALIAVFATPAAVNTFPLAAAAGVDSELAGEMVVFTTACSIFTLFAWIWLLNGMGIV